MSLNGWRVCVFSELGFLSFFHLGLEAILKITGAKVAYTRPRTFQIFPSSYLLGLWNFFFAAYGEYNDVTIEVANARSQILVNWDFEYATVSY